MGIASGQEVDWKPQISWRAEVATFPHLTTNTMTTTKTMKRDGIEVLSLIL